MAVALRAVPHAHGGALRSESSTRAATGQQLTGARGALLEVAPGHVVLARDHGAVTTWTPDADPWTSFATVAHTSHLDAIQRARWQPLSCPNLVRPIARHSYPAKHDELLVHARPPRAIVARAMPVTDHHASHGLAGFECDSRWPILGPHGQSTVHASADPLSTSQTMLVCQSGLGPRWGPDVSAWVGFGGSTRCSERSKSIVTQRFGLADCDRLRDRGTSPMAVVRPTTRRAWRSTRRLQGGAASRAPGR
jgi:hypothetical protein